MVIPLHILRLFKSEVITYIGTRFNFVSIVFLVTDISFSSYKMWQSRIVMLYACARQEMKQLVLLLIVSLLGDWNFIFIIKCN